MCCSWNAILIVPFYKSQDTLLHPGLNEQIQNTSFIEVQRYWHVTVALLGGFDWQPGSGSADFNWSALVNHIGIQLLPATQSTLIGHAQYIKPRPSQFSVQHGNGEFYWIRLFYGNGVTIPKPLSYSKFLWCCCLAQMAKTRYNNPIFCWDKPGYFHTNLRLTSNIVYA